MGHHPLSAGNGRRYRPFLLPLVVMLIIIASACGSDTEQSAEEVELAGQTAATGELPEGRVALDMALETGQPVVLWFWGAH